MSFLKNIFGKREEPIKSNDEFWRWFELNERTFFNSVKEKRNIEGRFLNKLGPKLGQLKEGYFFLTGMCEENTADLVLTADGNIKNIVFVEELANAAPKIEGWQFTALKQPIELPTGMNVNIGGYTCNLQNLGFYSIDNPDLPDEINITVVHNELDEDNQAIITNGVYIFLDNLIGELQFATTIDKLKVIGSSDAEKELIPVEKLADFLLWRQKEFVEKYEGVRRDTENDAYTAFQAELKNGHGLVAIINSDLLNWDSKASHPWIVQVNIKYFGKHNKGMPNQEALQVLEEIEKEISNELKDFEGYLNIGRQTSDNVREIYYACKDFRKPSKILYDFEKKYCRQYLLSYEIYKDKYWQSFNRFEKPNDHL